MTFLSHVGRAVGAVVGLGVVGADVGTGVRFGGDPPLTVGEDVGEDVGKGDS